MLPELLFFKSVGPKEHLWTVTFLRTSSRQTVQVNLHNDKVWQLFKQLVESVFAKQSLYLISNLNCLVFKMTQQCWWRIMWSDYTLINIGSGRKRLTKSEYLTYIKADICNYIYVIPKWVIRPWFFDSVFIETFTRHFWTVGR